MKTKYACLTYLFGEYDKLHPVLVKTPDTQYICVTDNPNLKSDDYTIVYKEFPDTYNNFDKCLYVRYHPFSFCDADVVIRVDASVQVCGDLTKLFQDFENSESQLAVHIHPTRNTVYDELTAWCYTRNMPITEANNMLQFMGQFEGYDVKDYKHLVQLSWTMEKNTTATQRLDELTYAMNKYAGGGNDFRCDQVTYSFVIAKYFNQLPIDVWDMRILEGELFKWYPHGSDTPFAPMGTDKMIKAHWLNKRITTKREQDL